MGVTLTPGQIGMLQEGRTIAGLNIHCPNCGNDGEVRLTTTPDLPVTTQDPSRPGTTTKLLRGIHPVAWAFIFIGSIALPARLWCCLCRDRDSNGQTACQFILCCSTET